MSIKNEISVFFEFNIKQVGLYSGLFFSFAIMPMVYFVDLTIVQEYEILEKEYYKSLISFNNSLPSLLIAILLTTFSVVFVIMQLASSQFSPRILRFFMANDLKIQQFIGIYLGAISSQFLLQIFCPLYPIQFQVSVITSIALSLHCILFNFPKVIIHLNDNMNVATITNKIKTQTIDEIKNLYEDKWKNGDFLLYKTPKNNLKDNQILVFWDGPSGYLSEVDYSKLSALVKKFTSKNQAISDVLIYQKPIVGEFIMNETTVVLIIETKETLSQEITNAIIKEFNKISLAVFKVHKYRSYKQDINFGVRKLVDISIKAISPAVNDPTTCLNCLDSLGEIIRQLSIRKFPSKQSYELKNKQILINEFDFDEIVNFAFDQIYQWGKKDPVIVKRLVQTIYLILPCVLNPHNLKVLIEEVECMELEKIYTLKKNDSDHTTEQIELIQKEYNKFKRKAIAQIEIIKNMNILDTYEMKNNEEINNISEIRKVEIESIDFLKKYIVKN